LEISKPHPRQWFFFRFARCAEAASGAPFLFFCADTARVADPPAAPFLTRKIFEVPEPVLKFWPLDFKMIDAGRTETLSL
jgi:hypothetical protein